MPHSFAKTNKRRAALPPGQMQLNISRFPIERFQYLERMRDRRRESDGITPKKCAFLKEVMLLGLDALDPETGTQRRPVAQADTSMSSRNITLPVFSDIVDTSRLTDIGLITAMNAAPMLLWTSKADRKNFHVNPPMERYTGAPAEAFRGDGWIDFLHPLDQKRITNYFAYNFEWPSPFWAAYRLRRHDGLYGVVADYVEPRFPLGAFGGHVGTVFQISMDAGVVVHEGLPFFPAAG